jgi:type II secretory pathway component PulM
MSDERRKRQLERVGTLEAANPQSRKKLIWGGIVVLFVLAYAAGWEYKNHRYDGFAKCLATKQAKMYGLYWCPHCAVRSRARIN